MYLESKAFRAAQEVILTHTHTHTQSGIIERLHAYISGTSHDSNDITYIILIESTLQRFNTLSI